MNERIETFLSYIHCITPIGYSEYREDGVLSAPLREDFFLDDYLRIHHFDFLKKHPNRLVILGAPFGISWASLYRNQKFYILGPVTEQSNLSDTWLSSASDLSPSQKRSYAHALDKLPFVLSNTFLDYGLMFYYAVTGDRTSFEQILFETDLPSENLLLDADETEENLRNCWLCEQQIYDSVRNGYSQNARSMVFQFHKIALRKLYPENTIRNKKNLSLFSLALCVRASVHGGLPIITAYALEAHYTKQIEAAKTMAALSAINISIIEDFASRVHDLKLRTARESAFLIDIEEYVLLNIEGDLRTETLATEFEYTHYYLTRKYKAEKGISLQTFIRREKCRHAAFLLENTTCSVSEISERLQFNSVSHFISEFKKIYKTTPGEYRKK